MSNSYFISFEGPEGSGKSSQAKRLAQTLRSERLPVVEIQDPGSTRLGKKLRKVILKDKALHFSPLAEAMVFIAGRIQLVMEYILPALRKGKIVICDRYHDSTVAYQGYGGSIDPEWLDEFGRSAISDLMPDLTIFLDVPVKVGFSRLRRGKDRMEEKNRMFHEKVRRGYRLLAKAEPNRMIIVDGTQNPDIVAVKILSIVRKKIRLES